MRATLTEVVHLFLQFPLWIFIGLVFVAVWAWRQPAASRPYRLRHLFAVSAVLYYVAATPWATHQVASALERAYEVPPITEADRHPDNVILVLTAGWLRRTPDGHEQKLGEAGWIRIWEAVQLWRRVGGRILVTGAPHPSGKGSAAEGMAEVARQLGVPADAILVEPAARNTFENISFSKRMIGEPRRTWLVTSAHHMARSVSAARAVGLEVIPYPCDRRADEGFDWTDFFPNNASRGMLEPALHELLGIVAYRVRGSGQ